MPAALSSALMKTLKPALLVALLCLLGGPGSTRVGGASGTPLLGILQSELQRNIEVLGKEPSPLK